MEIVLAVEQGPDQGRKFYFHEGDNFLVGRADPLSLAHLNLSPEDLFVGRHHFTIEVRPPNCLIRDNGSKNGTFVCRRGRQEWERIDETLLADGDRIKVGHTILSVSILTEPEIDTVPIGLHPLHRPKPTAAAPDLGVPPAPLAEAAQEAAPEFVCIRCGGLLDQAPGLEATTLRSLDFMCPSCRAEFEARAVHEAATYAAMHVACSVCGNDLTSWANADGRAVDLAAVASYLCNACATAEQSLQRDPVAGYIPLKELGRGGMGIVYKAWHLQTGRVVALKQMLPMARVQRDLLLRFMRETIIMEELHHSALVHLIEAGQQNGVPFFVSEFVPDGNLAQFVSERGQPLLSPFDAVQLVACALDPLAFMHERGYIHRDIKPENILIRRRDGAYLPKLADFGLARNYERHGGTISRTGNFSGTIMYMPPEQILSFKHCQPTVDVYAMGVTLYYLLTGCFPLDMPSPWQVRQGVRLKKDPLRIALEDPPHPIAERRGDLPPALCRAVDKAVVKEATRRYPSAREFQAALWEAME